MTLQGSALQTHTDKEIAKLFQAIYEYEISYSISVKEKILQGADLLRMNSFPGILKIFIFIETPPDGWLSKG